MEKWTFTNDSEIKFGTPSELYTQYGAKQNIFKPKEQQVLNIAMKKYLDPGPAQ